MRYILIIGIMGLFTSTVFAQAADPNAIDFSGRMDTVAIGEGLAGNSNLIGFLNIGLQNPDKWEDFEVDYSEHSNFAKLRFGGTLLFDTINTPILKDRPMLYGDFDGDGIGDIIGADYIAFYKGKKSFPYFDSTYTSKLRWAEFISTTTQSLVDINDYNGDGIKDVFLHTSDGVIDRLLLYNGGSNFSTKKIVFPNDSVQIPIMDRCIAGNLQNKSKTTVLLSKGKEILLVKDINDLSHSSLVLISDTIHGMGVKNMYVTDITGDGIPDLLITDSNGYHIYIFKGGDDFGTYLLTPQTAFYTLHSPSYLDFDHFDPFNHSFGMSMHAVGDLTGSGIPYLAVNYQIDGLIVHTGISFFYAGGKALDTLYDAIIRIECDGLEVDDTLHSINSTGRTVALVNNFQDANAKYFRDIDFLMSRDCEKIPHVTNPQMVAVRGSVTPEFSAIPYPSFATNFTKLHIKSPVSVAATVTVSNILGEVLERRNTRIDVGENIEFFNTSAWASGTYNIAVESDRGTVHTKIIVHH